MPGFVSPFDLMASLYRGATVTLDYRGFAPEQRATFVSAKVAKTMLAVLWPFGFPARFAAPGVAQTHFVQTVPAFSPVSAARLGHTTRLGERAETMSPVMK